MSVRKSLAGALVAAVAASTVAFTAGTAHAVYAPQPEDSKASPAVPTDLIGVGSDTTMLSLKAVADKFNADPAHAFDIATFGAFGGGTLPIAGDPARPNGSSAGKAALLNPAYAEVDFARSSDRVGGSGKEAEGEALAGIPFALDTVVMAVSGSVASHAPATLTLAQLKSIYLCEPSADNWADLGGPNAPIKAYIPQSGSGTEKFFKSTLGISYGSCVKDFVDTNGNGTLDAGEPGVQEHRDDAVKNDAAAIVPISKGRAQLIPGNTLRLLEGEVAFKRAVYNVVRAADLPRADIQAVFGENGFLCSAAAADAIAAGGLVQLATPANGGACGTPADTTSNFATNAVVATTTSLSGTQSSAGVQLVARVTGSSQPSGSVSFYEGATLLRADQPIVSGQATFVVPTPAAGAHTYRAVYKPSNAKFLGSEATVTVNVTSGPSAACLAAKNVESNAAAALTKAKAKVQKAKKAAKKAVGAKKVKAAAKVKRAKKALKSATATAATAKTNATAACK